MSEGNNNILLLTFDYSPLIKHLNYSKVMIIDIFFILFSNLLLELPYDHVCPSVVGWLVVRLVGLSVIISLMGGRFTSTLLSDHL